MADDLVALRPWRRSGVPKRFDGFSDALCLRFSWPLVESFTREHVRARLDEARDFAGKKSTSPWSTRPQVIGCGGAVSVYDVDPGQARAAVGYWLAREARGRGAATRALRLPARWAFDHLAVERWELTCAPDNLASQRVAERCGFVREGVLRSHLPFQGGRRDSVMFSLLPGELP